jgi:arylsulfatase A-like enzyme
LLAVRPNVLLIVFDTARADAFEPYGAKPGASPAVADLARRGGAMPAMFAPACWTLPSHAAFFMGLLPRATGLIKAPGGSGKACREPMEAQRGRLLPEVMRRAGFETGAVSANLWISERTGFATGFERFESVDSGRQAKMHGEGRATRLTWDLEGLRAHVDDGAAEVGRVLRTWVGQRRERPFFWFVNLVECHSPYLPPRRYSDLGPIARWRAAKDARHYLTLGSIWQACAGGLEVPDEALERMRTLYAGAIRYLDDWLASVLESLEQSGLLDDTLVIVTSDHGENIGENGLMGHAYSLDNRLLHVPFVAAGPTELPATGAHSLAELPRLIADAVGVENHPWTDGLPPAGAAVAQFDPPTGPDDPRSRQMIDEWGLGDDAFRRMTSKLTAATDGRYKLLLNGDREAIYDLETDPLEGSPLDPGEVEAEIQPLRAAIDHSSTATRAALPAANAEEEISEEERRHLEDRMRLLGYL